MLLSTPIGKKHSRQHILSPKGSSRLGKLQEFKSQIDEMEKMGTIIALTEDEVKGFATEPNHYNKLGFTMSSLKSSQGSTLTMVSPAY